jgi:hypothetical protein
MRRLAATLVLASGLVGATSPGAFAQTAAPSAPAQPAPASPTAAPVPTTCTGPVDPYKNYACLDDYLGQNVFVRLFNYYRLEYGESGPPTDPNAPPSRRDGWPATPETTPPMPFTEWPYGATTSFGVNRPSSADSPLMVAIANTGIGQALQDAHIQIYGWVDGGGNISSNSKQPGGNIPIAYAYTPNAAQLDQAVLYIERTPDTVQSDHVDWGFRLSGIYGENYRYTTAYGLASYQLLKDNLENGYDFPMEYGELFIPQVAEGLMIRVGRYISIPDIEAQLAPNNYLYTHSLTYGYDNYTNEGIVASLAATKNLTLQLGVVGGTEAAIWHVNNWETNPAPTFVYNGATIANPLYGGKFRTDPGAVPSVVACVRFNWNDGRDNLYPCMDGINGGQWGYNNLQWYGFTYYHKFDDHWHISFETYDLHQNGVPNARNPEVQALNAQGGTDFGTPFGAPFITANNPNEAQCKNVAAVRCNTYAIGAVAYINYSPDPLNNFTFRPEIYYDPQGQRTGTAATYYEFTLAWQHWLSPQIEFRPEIGYYHSDGADAFNGGTKNFTVIADSDVIVHF